MRGVDELDDDTTTIARVVKVNGGFLNRYFDDSDTPRAESYAEDRELAATSNRNESELYRNVRAGCESGWDFSSRWLGEAKTLESIRTTDILPVDLNTLLWRLETVLAKLYAESGDSQASDHFAQLAARRKELLRTLFFDDDLGFFTDIVLPTLKPSPVLSLAATYPLFLKVALPEQAAHVVQRVHKDFLAPGGWLTTSQSSGQQWDIPNGWAPLQWIVFASLRNYGFSAEAEVGAKRWVENNLNVYRQTGRLLEKYDVAHVGALATGGEYAVQDGFGWTNAVLLKLMNHFELE